MALMPSTQLLLPLLIWALATPGLCSRGIWPGSFRSFTTLLGQKSHALCPGPIPWALGSVWGGLHVPIPLSSGGGGQREGPRRQPSETRTLRGF